MAGLFPSATIYDRLDVGGILSASLNGGVDSFWQAPAGFQQFDLTCLQNSSVKTDNDFPSLPSQNFSGDCLPTFGSEVWFDKIHVIPDLIALGNILSTQVRQIQVFSSFRSGNKELTTVDNNAGAGINITLPTLPFALEPYATLAVGVTISPEGPPVINGNITFNTDVRTAVVLITGQRVTVFTARPETPVEEVLEFLTDVMEARDGTEQRVTVRSVPRQRLTLKFLEEELERQNLDNLLFDWLARVWGVPIWQEERRLQADAAATDLTVQVDTTFSQFRAGGLALVFTDQFDAEALEIDSLTASSLTFTSPLLRAHSASNTTVMPVNLAYARTQPSAPRLRLGQQRLTMEFVTLDNQDVSDSSAFSVYKTKVLLDDPNLVLGGDRKGGQWTRRVEVLESPSGDPRQFGVTDRSRLVSSKGFFADGAQGVWQVRQLVHALKGSRISFYLPTFQNDLTLEADIGASATTFDVTKTGFHDFVQGRQPFGAVTLVKTDGTRITRDITGTAEFDDDTDRITIDTAFDSVAIPTSEVARMELTMLVRIRDDKVSFTHTRPGRAVVEMDVITVKE